MANKWQRGMWHFVLSEESPGYWRVTGTHKLGPTVEHDGSDEIQLLKDAVISAINLEKSLEGFTPSAGELEEMLKELH